MLNIIVFWEYFIFLFMWMHVYKSQIIIIDVRIFTVAWQRCKPRIIRNENLEIMLFYFQIGAHLTIVSNPIPSNPTRTWIMKPKEHKSRCIGFTRQPIDACCFPFLFWNKTLGPRKIFGGWCRPFLFPLNKQDFIRTQRKQWGITKTI